VPAVSTRYIIEKLQNDRKNMKQAILAKLRKRISYTEKVEELKVFWWTNNEHIKLITAHYFQFSYPEHYAQNILQI
jgi:hypothetical protein